MRLRALRSAAVGTAAWLAGSIVLILVAVYARLAWLGDRELFRDEAATWLESSYSLDELLRVAATEPYPPLYALIMKGWMAVAGDGEAALRALSVAASLVTIAVAWRWAHEALGRWPAVAAVLVLALSPVALSNARTARMYSLEAAFATAAWWITWRLITGRAMTRRDGLIHSVALAGCAAGEVWTMALGVPTIGLQLLVAGSALLAIARARKGTDSTASAAPDRPGAKWAIGALVVGGLSFLPWLPNLFRVATGSGAYWTPPPETMSWALTWRTMLTGWRTDLPYSIELGVLLLLVAGVGLAWLLTRRDRSLRWLAFCVGAGLALTALVWAVSLVRSIYDTRYLEASLAPLALAVAAGALAVGHVAERATAGLSSWRGRGRARASWSAPAAALVVGILLLRSLVPTTQAWLDDWRHTTGPAPTRELVAAIAPRLHQGDILLALDARSFFTLAYEAEMLRRQREPLPAPVRNWDSGHEPFYRGQSLIDAESTVTAHELQSRGWRGAFPELAESGSIWLIALANGLNENLDFAPLSAGRVREVDRVIVQSRNAAGQARQLVVIR